LKNLERARRIERPTLTLARLATQFPCSPAETPAVYY